MRFSATNKRERAARMYAGLAAVGLAGGLLAGASASGPVSRAVFVVLGVLVYLAHGSLAARLRIGPRIRRDASPFPPRRPASPAPAAPVTRSVSSFRAGPWPRAVGLLLLIGAAAVPAKAQQTIFNVPSGDVLDKGKAYLEADALVRPEDPNFAVFTGRGVYGFGANIEAGVNFGGFVTPGRSVPIATPNLKWQPWHNDKLAFTTGVFGLFYLRGSKDGDPAVLGYGEASYKLPTNTRLTAGGYWASSGYAAADPQAGALIGFEQKVNDHLNFIADWISGKNGLGYFTPGVSVPLDAWTIYLGYSFKNGDSRGNAILFELGFTF
ncbi:MAG TPA: hypothetical protein VIA45_05680 [Thermoanaerobaculia bacterium]